MIDDLIPGDQPKEARGPRSISRHAMALDACEYFLLGLRKIPGFIAAGFSLDRVARVIVDHTGMAMSVARTRSQQKLILRNSRALLANQAS